ncbi:VRR-NUC domain-containing protein, partial [Escherichia coli]|nr:VRR-NUC domain-containing protein [Escherichia coli]
MKDATGDPGRAYRASRIRSSRLRQIADLKAQGLRPGVPDYHLPVARGGYLSLYLELKVDKNRTSPEQKAMIRDLRAEG